MYSVSQEINGFQNEIKIRNYLQGKSVYLLLADRSYP